MRRHARPIRLKARDQAFGRMAEHAAEWALRLKGYRILARRWSGRGGEIDIVARRGALIVFVEVKARPDAGQALAAITSAKQGKLRKAIHEWQSAHDGKGRFTYRADAMLVAPWRWPRHVADIMPIDAP
jgi:putative endonuclease